MTSLHEHIMQLRSRRLKNFIPVRGKTSNSQSRALSQEALQQLLVTFITITAAGFLFGIEVLKFSAGNFADDIIDILWASQFGIFAIVCFAAQDALKKLALFRVNDFFDTLLDERFFVRLSSSAFLVFLLLWFVQLGLPAIPWVWQQFVEGQNITFNWQPMAPILLYEMWLLLTCAIVFITSFYNWFSRRRFQNDIVQPSSALSLWLGQSTGLLAKRSHGAALAKAQEINLTLQDACQNILCLGGTGSGKTLRVIQPLLLQLLDQNCGGLIFDIKGDFHQAVERMAQHFHKRVISIGPGFQSMNLIAGLTPEMAASFLKSALLLGNQRVDSFWLDHASELCRNTLGVLRVISGQYSLQGLYRYIFDAAFRDEIDSRVNERMIFLNDEEKILLQSYQQYHERIFDHFEEKVKSGILASVAQVLSPFNHPELAKAFCTDEKHPFMMDHLFVGDIALIRLPLSVWGLGGKVAYTFIKLRFFNLMQHRAQDAQCNQERPVFFMCDEYQDIISGSKDGLSDLNFWDKSRSSKTIGIISSQSISSFYAAIGDHDIANAILQNFRQKICFRTEDQATLRYLNYLTGEVAIAQHSVSKQNSTTSRGGLSNLMDGHHQRGRTETTTWIDKDVIDPQLMRMLQIEQAVALLNLQGQSFDDVINLTAVEVH